jgi:uncharacterized protein
LQRLTHFSLSHPRITLAVLAAASLFFAAGALRVKTDVGYRALLGHDHPTVVRFDSFLSRYDGGFGMAALYRCGESPGCKSVFEPGAIAMAADVARELAHAPGVRRVESVATSELWVPAAADGDAPVARRLADAAPAELPALGRRALNDSLWPRALVSEDGRAAVIALEVASSNGDESTAAYAALDAALARYEAQGWVFHRVGGPVEFVVAGHELQADTLRLVPVMVALIGTVLFVLFRSFVAAAATLATVGVAVLWSMGAMGWLGLAQNSITQALPPLMLVICCCDGIHLMALYASEGREHPELSREQVLERVVADIGAPCVFTAATTAGGFASFLTSPLESLAEFGAISAFGVMIALLLTFSLLPILALRIRPDAVRASDVTRRWEAWMERAVRSAGAHPGKILGVAAAIAGVAALGLPQLRIDARFEDLYGEKSRVVRWVHAFRDSLRRPDTLEVELIAPADSSPEDPKVLETVQSTAKALAGIEGLGPARSLPDVLALANQLGNEDDPFWRRVPTNSMDLHDLLEAMRARDGGELARFADFEGHRYRISLESEKPPQEEIHRIFREVDETLAQQLPPGWHSEVTGPLAVVGEMVDEIQESQVGSFATATAFVLALIAIFQRSVWAALLAAVPTLLPVLVTLGLLGFCGISLDIGGTMVAAVVIGIADDDAVHLLDQYRRRRKAGEPPAQAMDGALIHVGRALVTTSVALAIGFLALTVSAWQAIANFGLIAAFAITVALFAALFVLPACVLAWERLRARLRAR